MKPSVSSYPLRPRGALELFDVSLKLYKTHFRLLLGMAVLVRVSVDSIYFPLYKWMQLTSSGAWDRNGIPYLISFGIFFFFAPFLYGAVGYCLEAALDVRPVKFGECIKYGWLRYRVILSLQCAAIMLAILFCIILGVASVILMFFVGQSMAYSAFLMIPLLLFAALFLCGWMQLFGSLTLIPLLACFEYRSVPLAKLAWRGLQLSWSRAKTLIALVFVYVLGMISIYIVLVGCAAVVNYLIWTQNSMRGIAFHVDQTIPTLRIEVTFLYLLITTLWLPLYLIALGTFYVDVRIRKEAFDLECAVAGRGKMEQAS